MEERRTQNDHDLLVRLDEKVEGLIKVVNGISARDETYCLKSDFEFWRNILVGGLFMTVVTGILMKILA